MTTLETSETNAPTDPESSESPETPGSEEPRRFAGKYDSVEDLEKAYGELQKAFSQRGNETQSPGKQQSVQITAPAEEIGGFTQLIAKAGLDADEVIQQAQSEGKLTDEQYRALNQAHPGIGRAIIDDFIKSHHASAQAQQIVQEQIRTKATEIAGGEEQLDNLLAWGSNLPEARQEDLNRRLGDPNLYEGALIELQAAHREAVGAEGSSKMVNANTAPKSGGGPFRSLDEQTKAMSDKRYAPEINGMPNPDFDQAYYDSVNSRLMDISSNPFGG